MNDAREQLVDLAVRGGRREQASHRPREKFYRQATRTTQSSLSDRRTCAQTPNAALSKHFDRR
jgi:hypothetical protein